VFIFAVLIWFINSLFLDAPPNKPNAPPAKNPIPAPIGPNAAPAVAPAAAVFKVFYVFCLLSSASSFP
jgi:hypothetical protein